jgi:hypothetical protein
MITTPTLATPAIRRKIVLQGGTVTALLTFTIQGYAILGQVSTPAKSWSSPSSDLRSEGDLGLGVQQEMDLAGQPIE